jgi:hypothetical protein
METRHIRMPVKLAMMVPDMEVVIVDFGIYITSLDWKI